MKLSHTDAHKNYILYLDIIYYTATIYLADRHGVKVDKNKIVNCLIQRSPIIIGRVRKNIILCAIRDIYKMCHKNNHKNTRLIKLSRSHLKGYLILHDINIKEISWI